METVWDWLTVFGFAGLATLLLQRSSEDEPRDKLWHYAAPAGGFALANYLGNHEMGLGAGAVLIAIVVYIVMVLKLRILR